MMVSVTKDFRQFFPLKNSIDLVPQIGSLKGRLVLYPMLEEDRQDIIRVLDLAIEHFEMTRRHSLINIGEYQTLLKLVEENLQNKRNLHQLLLQILDKINQEIEVSKDPLHDPIMEGFCVIENQNERDGVKNLDLFPSSALSSSEYLRLLDQFDGRIHVLPKQAVEDLVDDPVLSSPSSIKIRARGENTSDQEMEFIPQQVLLDIKRFTELIVNEELVLRHQDEYNENLPEHNLDLSPKMVYVECLKLLGLPLESAIDLTKLITQASLAQPCTMVYKGFCFPDLDVMPSQALKICLKIKTQGEDNREVPLQVSISTIYRIQCISEKHPSLLKYICTKRDIYCDSAFLNRSLKISGKRSGDAFIEDLYSPLFDNFEEALCCDFEELRKNIQVFLKDEDYLNKSESVETNNGYCIIS